MKTELSQKIIPNKVKGIKHAKAPVWSLVPRVTDTSYTIRVFASLDVR